MNNDTLYTLYMHVTPSKKRYIGITSQKVERRWNNGKGYIKNVHFYRAIIKYGWDNIEHVIIATNLEKDVAKQMEIELIGKYNTTNVEQGYNITRGGDTRVCTETTREKLSKSLTGKPKSEHMKRALSETRKRMIYPKLTEEHKRKISLSLIGNQRAKGNKSHGIPIVQKTLDGEFVALFRTAVEAGNAVGCDSSSISKCCKNKKEGKYKGKYKGYIWEYANDSNS